MSSLRSTSLRVIKLSKATMVARALFNKLSEPNCFAIIFLIPATSKTVRTAPPAITPEPSTPGFRIILHAPTSPIIGCGIVKDFVSGICIKFFFHLFWLF